VYNIEHSNLEFCGMLTTGEERIVPESASPLAWVRSLVRNMRVLQITFGSREARDRLDGGGDRPMISRRREPSLGAASSLPQVVLYLRIPPDVSCLERRLSL
jgi:hypothetical protein